MLLHESLLKSVDQWFVFRSLMQRCGSLQDFVTVPDELQPPIRGNHFISLATCNFRTDIIVLM